MRPLKIFLLVALVLVVFTGFLNNSSAETEPIAHWSFDEGEGNIAHDESGNGNDGTLENGPVWVDGVSGSALHFDGIDEHLQFPDLISGELADFTVSVWFKTAGFPTSEDETWVAVGGGLDGEFAVGVHSNRTLLLQVNTNSNFGDDGSWFRMYSNAVISSDRWYHIVYIFSEEKDTAKIYLEGTFDSQRNFSSDVEMTTYSGNRIASNSWGFHKNYFSGTIDEVSIWNRDLSSEEIVDIYNSYNLSLPCQTGDIKLADDGFNQCVCAEGEWICTDVVCEECEICIDIDCEICIDCDNLLDGNITDEIGGEDESSLPSVSMIPALISIGLIARYRR